MRKNFKELTRIMLVMCMVGVSIFLTSCSNDDSSSSDPQPAAVKTVYKATSGFTDYTQKTLAKLAYNDFPESSVTNEALVPDIFVARAIDPNETWYLSEDKIKLAIRTCLEGKTVVFGAPSPNGMVAFSGKLMEVLDKAENEDLKNRSDLNPISLRHMLNQFIDTQVQDRKSADRDKMVAYDQKAYDAVAIRNGQIYFVHDIDEVYGDPATTETEEVTEVPCPSQTDEPNKQEKDPVAPSTPAAPSDYSALEADSIEKFVKWLSGEDISASRSQDIQALIDEYPQIIDCLENVEADKGRTAQRFVHNFVAYAGYENRKENVQVFTDVWAFCNIAEQKDWYYVRTSVMCNNGQLNFENLWDTSKTITPYFKSCDIYSTIVEPEEKDKQLIRAADCQPLSFVGTTENTTGFSVNFGGQVGLAGNGPSAGVTAGFTFSDSKTTSIPNISPSFNVTNENMTHWTFSGQRANPHWVAIVTECDSPPDISTKLTAMFDTMGVYVVDSDYEYCPGTVELETWVYVTLEWLNSTWKNWMHLNFINHYSPKTTKMHFRDYVRKPCNTTGDYIVSFDWAESGSLTPYERITTLDLYNRVLKEFIPDFGNIKTFFGLKGYDGGGEDGARSYFGTLMTTISQNKSTLKSRGLSGNFTFYIKKANSEDKISSREIEF